MDNSFLDIEQTGAELLVKVKGRWVFENISMLENLCAEILPEPGQKVEIRCDGLEEIDIAGAWVLYDRKDFFAELGIHAELTGFKDAHIKFLQQLSLIHI